MAIGQIKVGNTSQEYSRARADKRAFGSGVASAIGSLATAVGDYQESQLKIEEAVRKQREAGENFNVELGFIEETTNRVRRQEARINEAPEDGAGITDATQEQLTSEAEAWMDEHIPQGREDLRKKYSLLFAENTRTHTLKAFDFENKAFNAKAGRDLKRTVNGVAGDVYSGRLSYEDAYETANELIEKLSHLPEGERERMRQETEVFLRSAQFQYEVQNKLDMGDFTATLSDREKAMLGAIAGPESGGKWNVRYGGADGPQTFNDFSKHPNVLVKINSGPREGEYSTAAGAFQITYTTWKRLQKIPHLKLTDFSPASQVRAALYLLEERYNSVQPLGKTYDEIMAGGDPGEILTIKHATSGADNYNPLFEGWQKMGDDDFLKLAMGQASVDFTDISPSIWDDERYRDIAFGDKFQLASQARQEYNAQVDAQNKALFDDMLAAINNGQLSRQAIEDAQATSRITASQEQTLNARFDEVFKNEIFLAKAAGNMINPSYVWTDSPEDQKQQNAVFQQRGSQAMAGMDMEYTQQEFLPMVAQTGVIPSDAAAILSRQLQSTNEQAVMYALETMTALEQVAPDSFDAYLRAHEPLVDFYSFAGEYMPPNELVERARWYTNPQYQGQRDALKKTSQEAIKKFTPETVLSRFDDAYWGGEANTADLISPTATLTMMQDWNRLYAENFVFAQGNAEVAEQMTAKQLGRVWGNSTVGGELTFGKYMPERFPSRYPAIDDSLEWIDLQVRRELGLEEGQQFQLVGDAQTKEEADRGMTPSYIVTYRDENGFSQVAQGTAIPVVDADGTITTIPNHLPYRYRGEFDLFSEYETRREEAEERLKKQKKTKGGRNMQRLFQFFPRVGEGN